MIAANDTLEPVQGSYKIWEAQSRETVTAGSFDIAGNSNKKLADIEISKTQAQMFIIEYEIKGGKFGNHYLAGNVPFDLEKYSRDWLKIICNLPDGPEYEKIGK